MYLTLITFYLDLKSRFPKEGRRRWDTISSRRLYLVKPDITFHIPSVSQSWIACSRYLVKELYHSYIFLSTARPENYMPFVWGNPQQTELTAVVTSRMVLTRLDIAEAIAQLRLVHGSSHVIW